MVPYYGDFAVGATVYLPFNTFSSDDPSASVTITNLVNTDVHVHKNGGTAQRNNAAGVTVSVDYDSITGNHLITLDTSDNTVADFWTAAGEYQVRVEGTTIDGATVNAWVGAFSIERSGGALALLKNATYGLSAIETLVDDIEGRLTAARAGYLDTLNTGVVLADDAITAAKFDESTAFPLKSADTGATAVLRTGADSDTGETLSDQMDALASQASVNDLPTNAELAIALGDLPTASEIQAEMEENGASLLDTIRDAIENATYGLSAIRTRGDAAWVTATGFSTFNPAVDAVANVTLVDTCTTNTDMRGTDDAALAATALSDVVWTNTKAGYLDMAIGDIPTAAEIKTAIEASTSLLDLIAKAVVYKNILTFTGADEGNLEMFNAAGVSLGTVTDAYTEDATTKIRAKLVPA